MKSMIFLTRALLLGSAPISAFTLAGAAQAQEVAPEATTGDIVVTGVRAAQEKGIDLKRRSAEIVDAIVAEDIGKLPDVTIADSLQRVPGVQISRTAGEGGRVVIRGAPQVLGTLNGERFINAETIVNSEANFTDIPASLVNGVVVYKSQNASLTDGGVGGVVDLQTIRGLTLKDGLTANIRGELGFGSMVGGVDKKVDGLIGYKPTDDIGMSLGFSYGKSRLASSFQSVELDLVDEYSTWFTPNSVDLNGDGDLADDFLIPNGWNTYVNSRETNRERFGLAYNFNARLNDQLELVADVLYNSMDEKAFGQQLFVNGNFGGRSSLPAYSQATGLPSVLSSVDISDLTEYRHNLVTSFNGLTNGLRAGVQSNLRKTEAINTNLELRFKNDDGFSGSVRWVYGHGTRDSRDMTVAQQTSSAQIAQTEGGEAVNINPGSIPETLSYPFSIGMGKNALYYNIGDELASLAADPAAWYVHSSWLERTKTKSTQNILRGDGKWENEDDTLSLSFGARYSNRDMDVVREDYFSPSGFGNGVLTKYGEAGYAIGKFIGGTGSALTYDPLPVYGLDSSTLASYVKNVSDFGPVGGLNVTLPLINAKALTDPEAFRDMLYGEGQYIVAPDRTYGVKEKQLSAYMQVNFKGDLSDTIAMSGNVGVRVVNTKLNVRQNIVQSGLLNPDIIVGVDPNHSAYVDLGDRNTKTSRTKALPSINFNVDVGSKLRLKAAYYETQALQPLENLGRSEITFYNTEQIGEDFQRVSSVQRLGNPELEPWFARSGSIAAEWYPNGNTILSLGAFKTQIESYTYQNQSSIMVPDSDGVVRNGATLLTIAQGKGASYYGVEFGYQQSFTFLPSFLKYLGTSITYTFSPSQAGRDAATGEKLILADGSDAPFNDTAKHQVNAVLWYQDSKFQARIAANYLSKLYQGTYGHWSFTPTTGTAGVANWQRPTLYLDFGASYDVNENLQIFVNGSNLTEEAPVNYAFNKAFKHTYNQFERVITAGFRAKF
ncbi:TonB-dependent receptor [Sphingobium yanoikuyae]|uniref:TonB-dependent receptor n=1 Tax=Sphingobium yanoikuyae TaxID=13690 RepID=UPI0035AEC716